MPQPTYGIQNKTVPTTKKRWGRFSEALPDRIPGLTSAASVSFHLCELRHITLPRIDLHCRRFLPDWDPSPMAGSFLRSTVRGLALDSPVRWRQSPDA